MNTNEEKAGRGRPRKHFDDAARRAANAIAAKSYRERQRAQRILLLEPSNTPVTVQHSTCSGSHSGDESCGGGWLVYLLDRIHPLLHQLDRVRGKMQDFTKSVVSINKRMVAFIFHKG